MAALDLLNSSLTVTGSVTYPLTVTCTDRLSAIGEMAFTVFVGSPGASSCVPGQYVRWTDGSYTFIGIVETVARAAQEDGSEILTVKCPHILRELVWSSAGLTKLAAGDAPALVSAAIAAILASGIGAPSWSVTASAAVGALGIYLQSDGASMFTMLKSVADKVGAWLVRGSGRAAQMTATWAASGITARAVAGDKPANVAALLAISREVTAAELVTEIFPFAAGNAAVRVGVEMATASPPIGFQKNTYTWGTLTTTSLVQSTQVIALGYRQRFVQFPDINPLSNSGPDLVTAANALQAAAANWLLNQNKVRIAYTLTVDDSPAPVTPGQSLTVQATDLDTTLYCVEATHTWTPGAPLRSSLKVTDGAPWVTSSVGEQIQAMESARVYRAHAQLAPNVYQLSYTKPVDAQYGADFRFRFDEGITQVLMVALDVKLAPMESTVRAIGASGVKTSAYTYGGHLHSTTFAGHTHFAGDHTHTYAITLPAHTHNIRFVSITSADTAMVVQLNVGASTTPTGLFYRASGAGTNTDFPTQSTGSGSTGTGNTGATGAATVTSSGLIGSFNTSSDGGFTHDHTVDVTVTMEYGIYRDSAANTFAVADLEYQINSGAWLPLSGATSLGDSWYRLPLTNALVDLNTFYPLNKSNTVTVRAVAISAAEETFAVQATGASTYVWNDAGTLVQTLAGTVATAIALSANRWLYRLTRSDGNIRAYQPDATGTLVLWATFVVTINQYNAICVDARTGEKWVAGDSGSIVRIPDNLASVISGTPTLVAVAAIGGNVYARSTGTLYRMNTNAPTWPVTNTSIAGVGLAARNDGRVVTTSTTAAAFTLRVFESDLSASVNCVRSDAGNAWTPLSLASGANLVHVGCSDGRVRTYSLDLVALTATLLWTSTGTPGVTGYPTAINLLAVTAALSSKAAMIDAQLTVRSVVQAIVMT